MMNSRSCAIGAALLLGLVAATPTGAADTLYKYDALGRLTQVTYQSGQIVRYVYDLLGNRRIVAAAGSFSNVAPVAGDDEFTTPYQASHTFYPTINDTDDDGDGVSIVHLDDPDHGEVTKVGNRVVYTPHAGFWGEDSFTYTIEDPGMEDDEGEVTITVPKPPATQIGIASQTASSFACFEGGYEEIGIGILRHFMGCWAWPGVITDPELLEYDWATADPTDDEYDLVAWEGPQLITDGPGDATIDLGDVYPIDHLILTSGGAAIGYSEDGMSWTAAPSAVGGYGEAVEFGNVDARYITFANGSVLALELPEIYILEPSSE